MIVRDSRCHTGSDVRINKHRIAMFSRLTLKEDSRRYGNGNESDQTPCGARRSFQAAQIYLRQERRGIFAREEWQRTSGDIDGEGQ